MKKAANKTGGKTTTGVINNYKGYKGKAKKSTATGRPGPNFKKGGTVKK